jgi:hypothetical protein
MYLLTKDSCWRTTDDASGDDRIDIYVSAIWWTREKSILQVLVNDTKLWQCTYFNLNQHCLVGTTSNVADYPRIGCWYLTSSACLKAEGKQ